LATSSEHVKDGVEDGSPTPFGSRGMVSGWEFWGEKIPFALGKMVWVGSHGNLSLPAGPQNLVQDEFRHALEPFFTTGNPYGIYEQHSWFNDRVRNNGPWDFKKWSGEADEALANFGNFSYGATGAALGISKLTLLQEAGQAQFQNDGYKKNTSQGKPFADFLAGQSGAAATILTQNAGTGALGDDPLDYFWISSGVAYYQAGCAQ
jgi:hypothetical protein